MFSGQHQVSKGSAPPGVTAATAISFLQEKDDSYMVPTFQSVEAAYESIGRQTLGLAVQFWDVPRLVKIAGEDSEFDVQQLVGSQIANGTDLRVEPGSALPQSKAARQALITDLMNMGHISSEQGLELMEIGGSQKVMETLQIDKRQAQRENILMRTQQPEAITQVNDQWDQMVEQYNAEKPEEAPEITDDTVDPGTGMPIRPLAVPVNDFDNHEVHIQVHNNYRKSQAFASLPQEVKDLFDAHVKAHEQAMQGSMLKQLLSQIPTDGTTNGIPEPPTEGEPGGNTEALDESSAGSSGGLPSGEAMTGGPGPGSPLSQDNATTERG